jgi:Heparinase II/III-like protein/Heparinase II/III N-terminus
VPSVWRKVSPRVSEITWREFHERAIQELRKRLDLAKYKTGLLADRNGGERQSPYYSPPKGAFFFAAEDLPQIICFLRKHFSDGVRTIVLEADAICSHRFQLLGYDDLKYGPEIDWHFDAAHAKRAPLKPWFKIPFLNFSVAGDHKVTWELNRHQHLVTLAKAWVLTRDEKYAAELIQQWYAWRVANPFPMGVNWGSSLEVAFRSLSWLWMRFLLSENDAISGTFEPDLLRALALNGRYIERYLSTYFSPNTHLLGEGVALFFIGTLCPQIRSAARWRSLGWRIVLQEAERQIHADGVHFEQSLYYHVYALDFFLHARLLATHNQMEIPSNFDATLGRMLDVLQAVSQAGPPESFGDDDGGRLFDPRRNRNEHLTDPLAIGAIVFDRRDLKPSTSLTEEAIWLCGQRAVSFFDEISARPGLRSVSFQSGGIYVMANSKLYAQQMVIDAGSMGTGRCGHGHADALSVTVSLNGRRWLVDAGTFCYVGTDQDRDHFRGTSAHNTLQVDGLDQAAPDGPFGWRFLPSVHPKRWLLGSTFSMFAGSHTGYFRLPDPVLHRRFIFHLHGKFWFVRDCADGKERHRLQTSWHLAPDLKVAEAQGSFLAFPAKRETESHIRLALVPTQDIWMSALHWGELSPTYGRKQPGQILRLSAEVTLPAESVLIITPLLQSSDQPGRLRSLAARETYDSDAVHGYLYEEICGTRHEMFFAGQDVWTFGAWTSDAEFLYCGSRDGEIIEFVLCNGSFAMLNGKTVFAHTHKLSQYEWAHDADKYRASNSNDGAIFPLSHRVF